MTIYEKVEEFRKRNNYSQSYMADKLKVTRQTYMKMEKGTAPMTIEHLQTIANIFGISVEVFFYEPSSIDKFKEMFMRVLRNYCEHGVTKTKLAKLLYLIDFRHYYEKLESMSGVLYRHQTYGPVADPFLKLIDDLYEKGEIKIDCLKESGAQMIMPSSSSYNDEQPLLSKSEIKEIDEICHLWKKANTQEIVNFTHHQKPWMACRENEIIPYTLILQEDPDNVYKPSSFGQ